MLEWREVWKWGCKPAHTIGHQMELDMHKSFLPGGSQWHTHSNPPLMSPHCFSQLQDWYFSDDCLPTVVRSCNNELKYKSVSYLAFITHIDLLQQSARQSEDVIKWFVPEGACNLAVFGKGAHGLSLIHFGYQLMEYLHSYHTVIHWALFMCNEGRSGWRRESESYITCFLFFL